MEDEELFDFEAEAEPILQVLVGKALEAAHIEALEIMEQRQLKEHKRVWLQVKEGELVDTQRVEAARKRRIDESDRRNLQQRTAKNQRIWAERKVLARQMSKDYLLVFKRDTLQQMVEQGTLRRPRDFALGTIFVPQLYGQIAFDISQEKEFVESLDTLLNFTLRNHSKVHREAMVKEYRRKEERKKEQLREQREREEQKKRRKEERAAARERYRIQVLLEKIQGSLVAGQSLEDYTPQHKVYDVRDAHAKKDGIFLIGGFMGELIITFTCLLDYILANPQNQNFQFTQDAIEAYLRDLLIHENFSEGIITLHLARDPTVKEKAPSSQRESQREHAADEEEKLDIDDDAFMRFSLTKSNISDYGLGFFFEVLKDLVISKEFIETLYKVVIKIARTKLK